jgi:hypothetical protein
MVARILRKLMSVEVTYEKRSERRSPLEEKKKPLQEFENNQRGLGTE